MPFNQIRIGELEQRVARISFEISQKSDKYQIDMELTSIKNDLQDVKNKVNEMYDIISEIRKEKENETKI